MKSAKYKEDILFIAAELKGQYNGEIILSDDDFRELYKAYKQTNENHPTINSLQNAKLVVKKFRTPKLASGAVEDVYPEFFLLPARRAAVMLKSIFGATKYYKSISPKNVSAFERFKTQLRAEMEKPEVQNKDLGAILSEAYRSTRNPVGSGSTAAAVRYEVKTGKSVRGRWHDEKADQLIKRLMKWLDKNPNASAGDKAAAENVIRDTLNALKGVKK